MQRGFTLTEIAIVLVIIALLLGGVMAGRDLVHSAEIVASVRDMGKYKLGLGTFRMRRGLPGDYTNAEQRWGSAPACPTDASRGTCNGNGNGRIDTTSYTGSEATFFWQHLSLAGVVPGMFNPNWPLGPVGKEYAPYLSVSDWGMAVAQGLDTAYFYPGSRDQVYVLIGKINTQNFLTGYVNPSVRCIDALAVDRKIDDEKPGAGTVQGIRTQCTDTIDPNGGAAARYVPVNDDMTLLAIRAE